jgi:hypothetical protein
MPTDRFTMRAPHLVENSFVGRTEDRERKSVPLPSEKQIGSLFAAGPDTSRTQDRAPAPQTRGALRTNVLFVSIAFPPKSDPEALQAARYFKYLVRQPNFSVDVVTSKNPTLWMPTDPVLSAYAAGTRQHVDVPIFEPRLASVALLKLFPTFVMLPDLRQSFHWQWGSVTRALRRRPDVIYSRSFPLSSAIMGYKLARFYDRPWVMHLSDPWTESAILNFRGISLAYNQRMQMECFERAAAITLASSRMVDMYQALYPRFAPKFHLMPNVYDPDDVHPPVPRPPGGSLRLVYTGSLQGGRSVRHLFAVLDWCRHHDPRGLAGLSVELAGSVDSAERELLDSGRFPFVRHLGALSLAEAQRLQREADLLLVLDSPLRPEDSVFFPSKLLDYLVTGRPIFAITGHGSMTREIVNGSRGDCFDHGEVEMAGRWLLARVAEHRDGKPPACGDGSPATSDERFSAAANARRLAALMRELR